MVFLYLADNLESTSQDRMGADEREQPIHGSVVSGQVRGWPILVLLMTTVVI